LSGSASRSASAADDKRPGRNDNPTRVWVGGLAERVKEQDLEDVFGRYGKLDSVNIRSSRRDVFAFIEFKREVDALKAISELDQSFVRGNRVKCHWAQFKGRRSQEKSYRDRDRDRDRGRRSRSHSRPRRERRRSRSREKRRRRSRSRGRRGGRGVPRGEYKIEIENIPRDMTWMDLKGLGRRYGGHDSVTFARTWDEGRTHMGIIEFSNKNALRDTFKELNGHRINGNKVYCKEI